MLFSIKIILFWAKCGSKRLKDGKPLGERNRLTDKLIGEIQNYGLAIRRNTDDLEGTKKSIWAEYFHYISTNDQPSHALCDESWCKYKKATAEGAQYDHEKHSHILQAIMEEIKPIFRDLSNPELLKKCLHGRTRNPNESLNHVIWSRVPKAVFVTLPTLQLGVYDGVATFNDGNIARYHSFKIFIKMYSIFSPQQMQSI